MAYRVDEIFKNHFVFRLAYCSQIDSHQVYSQVDITSRYLMLPRALHSVLAVNSKILIVLRGQTLRPLVWKFKRDQRNRASAVISPHVRGSRGKTKSQLQIDKSRKLASNLLNSSLLFICTLERTPRPQNFFSDSVLFFLGRIAIIVNFRLFSRLWPCQPYLSIILKFASIWKRFMQQPRK